MEYSFYLCAQGFKHILKYIQHISVLEKLTKMKTACSKPPTIRRVFFFLSL
ncbi:hypothetical protein PORCRE_1570 [Porphyromonas crevioricanis JCM 15906]|uniref:Uncharacterized protein n=2 Tax=Porphyromonas crevioricanis TaxID=393921 RepID=A0A2X4PXJ7_9PORP|nr:hypothetical protein PORCRE_1570 [Porphyromonas crevioricanis JCM 15906]GAD07990.1 hypothetical protein PORCAN_1620 [Porphyromonas crevioricanis JCM 13913]SJZ82462.1 hypothetical protein SAMN02745203_00989 [Porphyromonas crevioricanis]SQH72597.1 Uncharacterised protein [Porphyromonas crevioricanis]